MPPDSSAPVAAEDDEDFRIALKMLLITLPHMTTGQLGDLASLIEEIRLSRGDSARSPRLFSAARLSDPSRLAHSGRWR